MTKKPKTKVVSTVLDNIAIALCISFLLMSVAAVALSICVLTQNVSNLLIGLSIITIVTVATTVIFFAVIVIFDQPMQKTRSVAIDENPTSIDEMSGKQFEEYVAKQLREAGRSDVSITPVTGDHGVDIIGVHSSVKFAIQCKRYKASVNTKAVQEVYAGKDFYDADRAVVITNSTFTTKAKEMAEKLNVELWDIKMLEDII